VCYNGSPLLQLQIFEMFFYGRYIILLMGAFSIFTGFLYNDVFSKSMHLFHPGWEWVKSGGAGDILEARSTGHVYPFGLDPTWHGADNSLVFTNSLKMKMSIILGVAHMTFAILLQVPNALHFRKYSDIWTTVVPQMLFMHSLFGYLVVMIFYKWTTDWSARDAAGNLLHNGPPGLLNTLIYMFLSPGNVDDDKTLYSGQAFVQTVLLLIAAVCVPWMLLAKPYLQYKEHQAKQGAGYQTVGDDDEEDNEDAGGHDDGHGGGGEFNVGETLIYSSIHTIEFCLGCISNTASYLRLWALSLAHAQLSEVLWTMTIQNVFGMTGIAGVLATVAAFAIWFALSIAVLVLMEGLSAFLHALRLHWVEASSKHYMATGTPFRPLTYDEE
jgi:V-type H+-transporting ATPase subunit a